MTFEANRLSHAGVAVEIVPERGALVTSVLVHGTELLYLDRSALHDPTKNVRGGIPLLFPFAGKLVDGCFVDAGTQMKQHGFARNRPFSVVEQRPDRIRVRLEQNADTWAQYPYEYEVDFTVAVLPGGVHVELMVQCRGTRALPLAPGFHPYFCCPAARKDHVVGDVAGFAGVPHGDDHEFDFGLTAPPTGRTRFDVPGLGALRIEFSPAMRHMQFWSQPGRDFICLEPFLGPADTINTKHRLDLGVGEAREFWMRIERE